MKKLGLFIIVGLLSMTIPQMNANTFTVQAATTKKVTGVKKNRVKDGSYYCNSTNISRITAEQKDLLNKLYTTYNGVRHVYSHWSAEDLDVSMISDITQAREYIIEGLTIVNEYYKLF